MEGIVIYLDPIDRFIILRLDPPAIVCNDRDLLIEYPWVCMCLESKIAMIYPDVGDRDEIEATLVEKPDLFALDPMMRKYRWESVPKAIAVY